MALSANDDEPIEEKTAGRDNADAK